MAACRRSIALLESRLGDELTVTRPTRREDDSNGHKTDAVAHEPAVTVVTDTPPDTVPDVRGMSVRDAVRRLVTLGVRARAAGDGFVVSQDPSPGTPIEPGAVCRLVLERGPARQAGRTDHP